MSEEYEREELRPSPFDATIWLTPSAGYALPRYNVFPHLIAGSMLLIVAPPKHGKSFVSLELAWAIASGRPFLGEYPIDVQGAVLYVAGEGAEEASGRFMARHRASGEAFPRRLGLYCSPIDLSDSGTVTALIEWAQGQKFAALIFDTVSRCGGGKEDAEDMVRLVAQATRLKEDLGVTIILLHHSPKADKITSRGHTSLPAAVDAQWNLDKADGVYTLTSSFSRSNVEEDKPLAVFRIDGCSLGKNEDGREVSYGYVVPCAPPEKPKKASRETLTQKIHRMVGDEGLSNAQVAEKLKVSEGTIRYHLKKRGA